MNCIKKATVKQVVTYQYPSKEDKTYSYYYCEEHARLILEESPVTRRILFSPLDKNEEGKHNCVAVLN